MDKCLGKAMKHFFSAELANPNVKIKERKGKTGKDFSLLKCKGIKH